MLNKTEIEVIKKSPKTNLHIHLDGSIRPQTMIDIAKKDNINIEIKIGRSKTKNIKDCSVEEIIEGLSVKDSNKDLIEYLTKFSITLKFLQTKENIERITYELIEDMKEQDNIVYSEIRYAPFLHLENGLKPFEVVESVKKGIEKAEIDLNVLSNQILCVLRSDKGELAFPLIELAKKYVCAIDIAGDEFNFPVTNYSNFLKEAKNNNIPITVHAGEARDFKSVRDSIELGATRIGHGINAIKDKKTLSLLKEKNIILEICPISNYQTKAVSEFKDSPLIDFKKLGVKVTLNTDNNLVSNTTLLKEINYLDKYLNINYLTVMSILEEGFHSAFELRHSKEKILELFEIKEIEVDKNISIKKNINKINNY